MSMSYDMLVSALTDVCINKLNNCFYFVSASRADPEKKADYVLMALNDVVSEIDDNARYAAEFYGYEIDTDELVKKILERVGFFDRIKEFEHSLYDLMKNLNVRARFKSLFKHDDLVRWITSRIEERVRAERAEAEKRALPKPKLTPEEEKIYRKLREMGLSEIGARAAIKTGMWRELIPIFVLALIIGGSLLARKFIVGAKASA